MWRPVKLSDSILALASCFDGPVWEKEMETKPCIYCKEEKPLSSYPRHRSSKDRLDSRCYECKTRNEKRRLVLKKTAPPKPDVCECCGINPVTKQYKPFWVIDHDHVTDLFRGWLCDDCNTGIGKLGDTLEGVMNAVRYFESRAVKLNDKI